MMLSVADVFRSAAMGVIMTGMGSDGLKGMTAIARQGGITIGQNHQPALFTGCRVSVPRMAFCSVCSLCPRFRSTSCKLPSIAYARIFFHLDRFGLREYFFDFLDERLARNNSAPAGFKRHWTSSHGRDSRFCP